MFKVPLNKTVANKASFEKVVDVEFKTFTVLNEIPELTVDEFFVEYERLFFEIPIEGELNSHQYLAKKSGEISNFQKDTTDIQPLLDEIASLREQLLNANLRIVQLETSS